MAFIQARKNAGFSVYYSKIGDYKISEHLFDIGGKNKTRQQLKDLSRATLVKDDINFSFDKSIPLIDFGFLY